MIWLVALLAAAASAKRPFNLIHALEARRRVLKSEFWGHVFSKNTTKQHPSTNSGNGRALFRLEEKVNGAGDGKLMCDTALATCMSFQSCFSCFSELKSNKIDWATVAEGVSCQDALPFVYGKGHCEALKSDTAAAAAFCMTYDACVNPKHHYPSNGDGTHPIDCSQLDTCDFEGFHEQFLGDGVCHDKMAGCYNSKVCGWDGGDCCESTCSTPQDNRLGHDCGSEGYVCRDPNSLDCDPSLNSNCRLEPNGDGGGAPMDSCGDGKTMFRLVMFDSFGDGWEETTIKIYESSSKSIAFYGALEDGYEGTAFVCLSSSAACYSVVAKGGIWGKECSWEIRPNQQGAPVIAKGGSPMTCEFGVAGGVCSETCNGKANEDPTHDPEYKDYKTMMKCVERKCPIQISICSKDEACDACLEAGDNTPEYCRALLLFNALIDCALCQSDCTEDSKEIYCTSRISPGISPPLPPSDETRPDPPCSPSETIHGSAALMEFKQCTEFNEVAMLMIDFDQNNFGDLDKFEACAHEFRTRENNGGHSAQDCMKILVNAMSTATQKQNMDSTMADAIGALARLLYQDASNFCECSAKAIKDSPLCPSFWNFKTLLYETVDACIALDEIDCDAWAEFYDVCKDEVAAEYSAVNFNNPEQCRYVHHGCGRAGPFPSFRRLDCESEVPANAWSFYQQFSQACLGNTIGPQPPPPALVPTPAPVPGTASSPNRRPYVPPEERDEETKNSTLFFWNLFWLSVLSGGCYVYYQRYGVSLKGVQDWVERVSHRRHRVGNSNAEEYMYSGIAMERSPVSLESSTKQLDSPHQYIQTGN